MHVVEQVEEMQSISEQLRKDGHRIALVPTMGCLHLGHASLIETARSYGKKSGGGGGEEDGLEEYGRKVEVSSRSSKLVVSIFTNPAQFNSVSDYLSYQKNLDADLELCKRIKVDYLFLPDCHQMYPTTNRQQIDMQSITSNTCTVQPPDSPLNNHLEGFSRPGHFRGMLTVVCKLFNITTPHVAYFGEKDYQQLVLVRKMVADFNMRVDICPVNTVRDHDLLPLSSRNVRLSQSNRKSASIMYRMLLDAKKSLCQLQERLLLHKSISTATSSLDLDVLLFASALVTCATYLSQHEQHQFQVDYLELRCSKELNKVVYQKDLDLFDCQGGCVRERLNESGSAKAKGVILTCRLLTSVIVGGVRLLDNIEVQLNS